MSWEEKLDQTLSKIGLRFTSQRQVVYSVMLDVRDHPTAETVFLRAKQAMPEISMATVYNCLDTLVRCGLVAQVNLHRAATRYCPNMQEHGHFYCDDCGKVFDVPMAPPVRIMDIPPGFELRRIDVSISGRCPHCHGAVGAGRTESARKSGKRGVSAAA